MARKPIQNPIREGEISKIYSLAYPGYISGYELSKLLGKDAKEGVIYRLVNEYIELFDVKEDKSTKRKKKLIRSKSEYLFRELLEDMKSCGIQLNEREKEIFKNYLDNEFRQFLKVEPEYAGYHAFIKYLRMTSIWFILNQIFRHIVGKSLYSYLSSFDLNSFEEFLKNKSNT